MGGIMQLVYSDATAKKVHHVKLTLKDQFRKEKTLNFVSHLVFLKT